MFGSKSILMSWLVVQRRSEQASKSDNPVFISAFLRISFTIEYTNRSILSTSHYSVIVNPFYLSTSCNIN